MNHRETLLRAAAIAATALGLDIASGRALAAFYAQTAQASWIGVLFSGLCFGLAMGALARLARRMGAGSLRMLLRRLGCGKAASALYGLILFAALCMAVGEAAHVGALVLPVKRAGLYGALIALLAAVGIVLSGREVVQGLGAAFLGCLLAYMAFLLWLAELPQDSLNYGLELKLENNVWAALLLALVHAAVAASVSASAAVKLGSSGVQTLRLGMYSGLIYTLVLGLGNGVLLAQKPIVLRLKTPFTALCCAWGSAGFYMGAAVIYMGCIAAMTGILYGSIPKRKCRILIEN